MTEGIDAKEVLFTVDPRENYQPSLLRSGAIAPPRVPYLAETVMGLAVRRHPEALISQSRRLRTICDRFRTVDVRALTQADYNRLSDFQLTCWEVLLAAESRKMVGDAKKPGAGAIGANKMFHTMQSLGMN